MTVRLSTSLQWHGLHHSGDEIDLPAELAMRLIAAGSAELIETPVETAALFTTPPQGKHNVRHEKSRRQ
jgi:hypothetical protein